MFQFSAFAAAGQAGRLLALPAKGLPHSEMRGSAGMCPSPRLIAAYRVLRRLSDPRHPPCALAYFAFVTTLGYSTANSGKRATLRFCYPLRQRTCATLISSGFAETAPVGLFRKHLNEGKDLWRTTT